MKPLLIEATPESPEVHFDASKRQFRISGRSLPENPHAFYAPVMEWLQAYVGEHKDEIDFGIQLDYFNSSSGRYLLELLQVFEKSNAHDRATIRWQVEDEDELMLEKGEEFSFLIKTPVKIEKLD